MKLDLELINLDEIERDIDNTIKILDDEKKIALEKIGIVVEEQVIDNIDRLKVIDTGKFKQSIHHLVGSGTVNKPGGTAVNKQGETVKWAPYSISHYEEEDTVTVADGVHYGVYLEYGTIRMPARPVLRPAPEQRKHEIEMIIEEMVENSMR